MRSHEISNLLKKRSFAKGLSLSELLIALSILAFAVCAIIIVYTLCAGLITTSKNTSSASNAAIGLMEEIHCSPFSQIVDNYDGLTLTINDIPFSMVIIHVDSSNPELLEVAITVCWRQGNRIIGEDTNLDGDLAGSEDLNNNGILDTPVRLVARIANR